MNDLAEKALQGLAVARQQLREHPMPAFAVAGFLASAGIVVAGARGGPLGSTRALTSWLGLVDLRRGQDTNELPAVLLLVAVAALVLLWLAFVEFVRRSPQAGAAGLVGGRRVGDAARDRPAADGHQRVPQRRVRDAAARRAQPVHAPGRAGSATSTC